MIHDDPCILSIKNGHKIRGFGTRISGCHPLKCPTMDPTPNWWQHRHCAMPLAFLSFLTEVQRGKKKIYRPKKWMILFTIVYTCLYLNTNYTIYIYSLGSIIYWKLRKRSFIMAGHRMMGNHKAGPHIRFRTSKPFKKGLGIWIWHLPSGNLFCRKSPFWMSKTHINGPLSIAISCVCWSSSRFD